MRYTYRQIIDSLPKKKNSNSSWWVKLWVRKISFVFTHLFMNLGFSSNAVSFLSIAVTLCACVLFCVPSLGCIIAAVALVNFWLILDCVDGNIARCKKQKTIYGEFVDDIGGYYTVAFVYLAIGICAFNQGGFLFGENNVWILIAGAASSISDILARLINKDYVNFSKNRADYQVEDYRTESKKSLSYIRRRIGKELGLSGAFMPLIILGVIFNCYDLITLFYLLFNLFALASTTLIYLYKADKYDRTHSSND